jgi:hypothetical protein
VPFTAREIARRALRERRRKANALEKAPRRDLIEANAMQERPESDVRRHRSVEHRRLLRNVRDAPAKRRRRRVRRIDALEQHPPAVDREQGRHRLEERALAADRGPLDRHDRAPEHRERRAIQEPPSASLDDVLDLNTGDATAARR